MRPNPASFSRKRTRVGDATSLGRADIGAHEFLGDGIFSNGFD
jgi:hypothetical protein